MRNTILGFVAGILVALTAGLLLFYFNGSQSVVSPITPLIPKPLLAYTFQNLKKDVFPPSQIVLGEKISEDSTSIQQIFYFQVPVIPNSTKMKRVSGLANIPKDAGNYPVIIMLRGFVPNDIYKSGVGTQPSAQVFVHNGFITLAPDFLGYGESASGSADGFEDRFQTYTTALTLLSSLTKLNSGLASNYSGTISADMTKIGIWGHSNGGHIALATLALSGVTYPTVLWAPVSTSFPYSILYYTDESDDQGKALRKALTNFEAIYNTDDFSPERYYTWIKAPIEINQGTADQEVPYWWSEELSSTLKKQKSDVTYLTYPGADHNMRPTEAWNEAVQASLTFYQKYFSQ